MYTLAVHNLLLVLLFVLKTKGSVSSSRSYSEVEGTCVGASPSLNSVHNVTVDCGDYAVLTKIALQCQRDLYHVSGYGFPWFPQDKQRSSRNNPNVTMATDTNNNLRNALDALDYVCYIQDRSQRCLEENDIRHYCLTATAAGLNLQTDFALLKTTLGPQGTSSKT